MAYPFTGGTDMPDYERIPAAGVPKEALLERLAALRGQDVRWRDNRAFGLVYHHSDGHTDLIKAAYAQYFSENGLNPMAFKSLQAMERGVVQMTADMLHGSPFAVGSMSSGGSESLLLAVLCMRNHARRKKPWIRRPQIVVPESAHVGFFKAGEYFNVEVVRAPVGPDYRADVAAMERLITRNTIMIAGSAPCYPYGVVDPIEALGALAQRRGVAFHVDACLGGFFLPWVEKLGYPVPVFDFRVPGVTSMSADVHKYGYAAKGASTIIYRDMDFFRDQIFAEVDWCGGVYGGATMAGSRPGGAIAAAWASLQGLGENGFVENARAVMETARRFREGIESIPELQVLGQPTMGVLAYGSRVKGLGAYAIADRLELKQWHVDRLQRPESIHMIVNPGHATIVDEYIADLREAVDYVKAHPDVALEGNAPMYGLIARMPLRKMVKRNVVSLFADMYSGEGGGPGTAALEADEPEAAPQEPSVPKPILAIMRLWKRLAR